MIDVSLGVKDEAYRKMLIEKYGALKKQVDDQGKQNEEYSNALSNPNDPNYSNALENKRKYEESQLALKMLNLELSLR